MSRRATPEYEHPSQDELNESGVISTNGFKTWASFCGKSLGEFEDETEARKAIRREMDRQKYWPNCYFVNDHGNVDLISVRTGRIYASWV